MSLSNRRDLLKWSSAAVISGLAGCSSSSSENLNTGRVGEIDSYNEEIELEPGLFRVVPMIADHFAEFEYTYNVNKPDEGFQQAEEIDIFLIDYETAKQYGLVSGLSADSIDDTQSAITEASVADISGEVSGSTLLDPKLYYLYFSNSGEALEDRTVDASIDATMYKYNRDKDTDTCDTEASGLVIEHLSMDGDYVVKAHIAVYDTTGDSYSLTMDLISAENEDTVTMTQERDICSTHFVMYEEVDLGFVDVYKGDRIVADISVSKDGEEYANTSTEFKVSDF